METAFRRLWLSFAVALAASAATAAFAEDDEFAVVHGPSATFTTLITTQNVTVKGATLPVQ